MPLSAKLQTNKHYYLLLIDIKQSTSQSPRKRQKIFDQLESIIKELNKKVDPKPAFKLTISYGDEVAGLFETPVRLYNIISQIREALFPLAKFRFVVAYGKIGVAADDIRKVGGEVFKIADEHIERLKKQNRFCRWLLKDEYHSSVLTALTEMSNALIERMTPYQRQVWQMLESGLNQNEIAVRLKKYPQSISNAVKKGRVDLQIDATQTINQILLKLPE